MGSNWKKLGGSEYNQNTLYIIVKEQMKDENIMLSMILSFPTLFI